MAALANCNESLGALYFINGRGDVLIQRLYRDDIECVVAAVAVAACGWRQQHCLCCGGLPLLSNTACVCPLELSQHRCSHSCRLSNPPPQPPAGATWRRHFARRW